MLGRATCVLLVLTFALNTAWAQDRSRSRYIGSSQDEEYDPEVGKLPESQSVRRIPSRRTRPTTPPADDDTGLSVENGERPRRLPARVQPHLEDSYELRQPFNPSSYNQPAPESSPQAPEDAPPSVQPGRRKRPKKRRRPKTEPKQDTLGIPEQPIEEKAQAPPGHGNEDFVSYRGVEPTPTPGPIPQRFQPRENVPPVPEVRGRGDLRSENVQRHSPKVHGRDNTDRYSSRNSETLQRNDRNTNRDAPQRSTSRYIDNSARNDNQRSSERTNRRQTFHPQQATNRLPVENNEDHLKFKEQSNDYSSDPLEHINKETHSQPSYPREEPARDFRDSYASVDDHSASRLPIQEQGNEDRLPHGPHEIIEPNVRLSPNDQPHTDTIYSHDSSEFGSLPQEPDVKLPLGPGEKHDHPSNSRYPVPSNRLTNPDEIGYQPHAVTSLGESDSAKLDPHIPDEEDRRGSASIASDRLPSETHRRSLPYEEDISLDRLSVPESRQPKIHPGGSVSSRAGSRYPSENDDSVPAYGRSTNEQIRTSRQSAQSIDPSNQRSGSRYQSRNQSPPRDTNEEHEQSRPDVGNSRSRSRYQPEETDSVRYNPSRAPQQERSIPPVPSTQPRSIPRTRTRYQADTATDLVNAQPHLSQPRRVPDPPRNEPAAALPPQRGRSRHPVERPIPPTRSSENQLNHANRPPPRSTSPPEQSRSRHQSARPSLPSQDFNDQDVNDQAFHRSRPQYDSEDPYVDSPRDEQPEYVPEYQSVQRVPERRPEPRAPVHPPQVVDTRSRQRASPRQNTSRPPPNRPSRGGSEAPRSSGKTTFECIDPYGFYPDENQCDKYYECQNGTAVEGLCSDGLAFNLISAPTYLRCDSIRDIDCSARPELQPPQSTKNCPRRFGLYGDEKDCTKFWHCVDGAATQVKCPPGLVYDDSKGTCNWADLVEKSCSTEDLLGFKCPETPTSAGLKEGVYLRYAHPDNCQLHFTCIKGTDGLQRPRMLSCNEGHVFDPQTHQCTRPENVPGCEEFYGKPVRTPPRKPARDPPPEIVEEEEEEEVPRPRNQRRRRPSNQRSRS